MIDNQMQQFGTCLEKIILFEFQKLFYVVSLDRVYIVIRKHEISWPLELQLNDGVRLNFSHELLLRVLSPYQMGFIYILSSCPPASIL